MKASDFDYQLPSELIAQVPLAQRSASRMLVLDRAADDVAHQKITDIIDYINPNDLLVFNNTKVIPARLFGTKSSGGQVECLVERVLPEQRLLVHLRSNRTPKIGTDLCFADRIHCTLIERQDDLFLLQCHESESLYDLLERYGSLPLPPYIERDPDLEDYDRYQTVFAEHRGAVAAPTAGLHFDEGLLLRLEAREVPFAYVTLHVGAGTFQPVRVEDVQAHVMHSEWMRLEADTISAIAACRARGGRVIAVGTTVARCLESAAQAVGVGEVLQPFCGETELFIYPGYEFRVVDGLLTNFHLPQSTLLMLVSAFAGKDLIVSAYNAAVEARYRFFSYGDAMLLL